MQTTNTPLETPPPFLSASVATSLHKSCGYICQGQTTDSQHQSEEEEQTVIQNADGSFTTPASPTATTIKEISSVKELLECQEKEIGGMKKLPDWATKILQECASKE